MYVTDTHSFLWFLAEDKRLGKRAKEIFEACDRGETTVVVPSIVLIESLFICEKKKLDLRFKKILEKIRSTVNYPIYPLDAQVVVMCQKLKQVSEPHDRIIVATSKILNTAVITKDERIKKAKAIRTIW